MKLRNSTYSAASKEVDKKSKRPTFEDSNLRDGFIDNASSLRLRRYKTYPSDYISEFNSLSLSETNSVQSLCLKSEKDNGSISFLDSEDRASSIDTISIYSESVCDLPYDNDDLYSEASYHSSIHRTVKKRKTSNFSDVHSEYDEDGQSEYSFKSINSNSKAEEILDNDTIKIDIDNTSIGAKFVNLVKLLLVIFLFFVLISVVLLLTMSVCISQNNQTIPLENIKGNLSKCLIGHEHSVPVILDAIHKFNIHYLERKIYFVSVVGPVGVGKSYTKQLIRNSLGSSVVSFSVLSSLLPRDMMSMEKVIDNLVQNLDICKPNVIFVDGFDDDNDITSSFLERLFEYLNVHKNGVSSSAHLKVLVIAFGTKGSSKINNFYLQHLRYSSQERMAFNFKELQKEMLKDSSFNSLSKISLHLTIVPFLPLEMSHLQECIIHQLNFISKNIMCNSIIDDSLKLYLKENKFTLKVIEEEVLKLSSIHKTSKILRTGCKRVYQLVSSLLFQLPNN